MKTDNETKQLHANLQHVGSKHVLSIFIHWCSSRIKRWIPAGKLNSELGGYPLYPVNVLP